MKHIAIIPARAGSRRVPGKNVKLLGGLPLIAWTINAAHASGCFDRVMVSTEDAEISDIAKTYGAEVPFLRPPELATDSASSIDVVLDHVARAGVSNDSALTLLQPTSPFRRSQTIQRAVVEFEARPQCSLIGVTTPPVPLNWHRVISPDGGLYTDPLKLEPDQRSCVLSGLIYIAGVDSLLKNRDIYGPEPHSFMVEDQVESLDIDTPLDWLVALACVDAGLVAPSLSINIPQKGRPT
jgi:CMP-N-acetylneuraminic acid synthetase